jgi:hypothetical protein
MIFKPPKMPPRTPLRPISGNSEKGKELSLFVWGQIVALSNNGLG